MAKKNLAERAVADLTIDELRQEHRALIVKRMTGPGDSERAMYTLQDEFGLDYWPQWNFQYKRERKPPEKFLFRLRHVILAVATKTVKKELAKLEIEAAKGNVEPDLEDLRLEAQELLAKIDAAKKVRVRA
jgi:hypothetical protein